MKFKLKNDTYVYIIYNDDLGLSYVGKHQGVWEDTNGNDGYWGSSAYLNAIRAEFHEYEFTKELLAQFNTDEEATAFETETIIHLHNEYPESCLNRAPNDGTNQWLHEGYGSITSPELKARLVKARNVVRPQTLKHGDFKCLILMKGANNTAHPPMLPQNDRTPFRNSKYWSKEMLAEYDAVPEGNGIHFFCEVHVSGFNPKSGRPYENYKPLIAVEQFTSEQAARTSGSYYSKLSSTEYAEEVEKVLSKA